jgi:hypothetical protein
MKRGMNSGNSCYRNVQNLLSSHYLSKNTEIKVHKIIILPVVLSECKSWHLTLKEERKLKVFENGC